MARADAVMTEDAAEAPGVAASVAAAVETTGVQTNALTSLIDLAVSNVFNEEAQIGGNTYVATRLDLTCRQTADPTKRCALFDPFNETPVEGVHYVKGRYWGQATSPAHDQTPRTYSFSAGLRF